MDALSSMDNLSLADDKPVCELPSEQTQVALVVPNKKPVPFMRLPAEIRVEIYKLILPNTVVCAKPVHGKQVCCLEADNQASGPVALLLLSRQVYSEAISLFYETAIFHIKLDASGLWFLGVSYDRNSQLPGAILRIVNLQLDISAEEHGCSGGIHWPWDKSPTLPVQLGLEQGPNRLKTVMFSHVTFQDPSWMALRIRQELCFRPTPQHPSLKPYQGVSVAGNMPDALDWNLAPLESLFENGAKLVITPETEANFAKREAVRKAYRDTHNDYVFLVDWEYDKIVKMGVEAVLWIGEPEFVDLTYVEAEAFIEKLLAKSVTLPDERFSWIQRH
ncbi:hypothetical protein BT63DRAFT_471065 [Microthyrium microscopicum]|uniref:Uncharacterized protein n=1 Tax=Microthyrium microscopicum TaxID=703497 RepID=A0A6A6UDP2_9PEZI|nr:hypothetical protein BT63DRAFT_471065 [Microthyrium microscopicum]